MFWQRKVPCVSQVNHGKFVSSWPLNSKVGFFPLIFRDKYKRNIVMG